MLPQPIFFRKDIFSIKAYLTSNNKKTGQKRWDSIILYTCFKIQKLGCSASLRLLANVIPA